MSAHKHSRSDVPRTITLTVNSDADALLFEQFQAFLHDADTVADTAPYGQVLNELDDYVFFKGREFLRKTLQQKLQQKIDTAESSEESRQCPSCKKKTRHRGNKDKHILTSNGDIKCTRRYQECMPCRLPAFPADTALGLDILYTKGLRRLAVRSGGLWSFEVSSQNLKEFCCIEISAPTINKICQTEAPKMQELVQKMPEIPKEFKAAEGDQEFEMDGTCVNTRNEKGETEWREMKVFIFSKRKRGESASPEEWNTRFLPKPSVTFAVAAIENKDTFRRRIGHWKRRLEVDDSVTALGDGATWIWDSVRLELGVVDGCLDIYHASEHICDCMKKLYKNEEEKDKNFEELRMLLLKEEYAGLNVRLTDLLETKNWEEGQKKSIEGLLNYLGKRKELLSYRERLFEGRSIGSGLIEGACKNLIGRRLKQTGAAWRIRRVNRMAVICSVLYSGQWQNYWNNAI